MPSSHRRFAFCARQPRCRFSGSPSPQDSRFSPAVKSSREFPRLTACPQIPPTSLASSSGKVLARPATLVPSAMTSAPPPRTCANTLPRFVSPLYFFPLFLDVRFACRLLPGWLDGSSFCPDSSLFPTHALSLPYSCGPDMLLTPCSLDIGQLQIRTKMRQHPRPPRRPTDQLRQERRHDWRAAHQPRCPSEPDHVPPPFEQRLDKLVHARRQRASLHGNESLWG